MILLDTHAVIWVAKRHPRARVLTKFARLHISPVTLLEVQFLAEAGRIRLAGGHSVDGLADDPRWRLDDPPAATLFRSAAQFSWTRDPFDRLLAAHARMRGWRLATADALLLEHLPASDVLAL